VLANSNGLKSPTHGFIVSLNIASSGPFRLSSLANAHTKLARVYESDSRIYGTTEDDNNANKEGLLEFRTVANAHVVLTKFYTLNSRTRYAAAFANATKNSRFDQLTVENAQALLATF